MRESEQSPMIQTQEVTNIVRRIAAEHKIINKHIVIIRDIVQIPSTDLGQINTLMEIMKKDIQTHFNIEENLFFDVALATLPEYYANIISKLILEHKQILEVTETLINNLKYKIENNEPANPPLKEKITNLLETITQHAKFELRELFPVIEENAQAKQKILKRIMDINK